MRLVAALLVLALLAGLSLAVGDQPVPPGDVLRALLDQGAVSVQTALIVLDLRLPRVALAALVGAALGVAGTVTQSVLRNPLAEPGILGLNSGAALAALLVMVWFPALPGRVVPWAALAGALLTAALIHGLAWRGGTRSARIILIGIGVGALMGAGASFLSAFGEIAAVQRAMLWLSGSLQGARWATVRALAFWAMPLVLLVWVAARALDVLAFDDAVAAGLGLPVQRARGGMIAVAAALAAATVAATGPIGFVGLMAPHLARRISKAGHARLVPMAAAVGAALLVLADLAGRSVLAPVQVPAGIVAALLGAVFFGWLIWRGRHD